MLCVRSFNYSSNSSSVIVSTDFLQLKNKNGIASKQRVLFMVGKTEDVLKIHKVLKCCFGKKNNKALLKCFNSIQKDVD